MKSKTLTLRALPIATLALFIPAAVFIFSALFVRADTEPVMTSTIIDVNGATTTSAQIGTIVREKVTLASTTSSTIPQGTVDFRLYPNTTCSGTPATQLNVPLVAGTATSSNTAVPSTGLSYQAHYNGQTDVYLSQDGQCKAVTATSASITLATTLSSTTVLAGSSVTGSAVLSGSTANATGTVSYRVYTNSACTLGFQTAGMKTVTNGIAPSSDSVQFNTPGAFYWQTVYSGDLNNASATSSCPSGVLTVLATTTPPSATTTPGVINGIIFNDLNKNDVRDAGEPGLSGWTVWLHKGGKNYNTPIVSTAITDVNGNYSFSNLSFGAYFVEEQEQSGWNQTSSDTKVSLSSTKPSATVNFSNVQKASGQNGQNGNGGFWCKAGTDGAVATSTCKWFDGFKSFWKSIGKHDNGKHLGQIKNGNNGKHKGDDNGNKGKDD